MLYDGGVKNIPVLDDERIIHSCIIADDCGSYQETPVSRDCRLILISGPDGCGKRTLAYETFESNSCSKKCNHEASFLQVSGQFCASRKKKLARTQAAAVRNLNIPYPLFVMQYPK
jgi:hypothetical protein